MKKRILIIAIVIGFIKAEAQTSAFKSIDSLLTIGRYKKALVQLKKLPSTFKTNVKTAKIYASIDDYKKAAKYYEQALLLKDNYTTKVNLGKAYQKERKLQKAISVFKKIVQKDTDNLLINYQLGKLYLQTKQPLKAKKTFELLINKDQTNANYHYQLGVAYAMLKKRNPKINSFLSAFKYDNEHIKAIHQLVKAYTFLRDKDSATIFIDKGLKVNPNHIKLNKLKINNLFLGKNYNEAVTRLKKLDSIQPKEFYTQKMLGRSFLKLNQLDSAKKYFDKALKIDQSDYKSYEYLGDIALKDKNYKTAEFMYLMSVFTGKEPRDKGYYGMAYINLQTKDTKKAIEFFKEAVKENHKNYRALYQLANTSENFYKDKKIAYELYNNYMSKFEKRDTLLTNHVKSRLKEIKKYYFKKGEVLE